MELLCGVTNYHFNGKLVPETFDLVTELILVFFVKPATGSVPKSKNDDQSALKEILSTMANDILDVTVFNQQFNQTMETGTTTLFRFRACYY